MKLREVPIARRRFEIPKCCLRQGLSRAARDSKWRPDFFFFFKHGMVFFNSCNVISGCFIIIWRCFETDRLGVQDINLKFLI